MTNNMYQNGYQGNRGGSFAPRQEPQSRFNSNTGAPARPWSESLNRSLFKSMDDLRDVQRTLNAILQGGLQHLSWLTHGEDGLYPLQMVIRAIHDENTDLTYVSEHHLVEVYLRDRNGELVLSDESIGHVRTALVVPPAKLYFGTTTIIADRAMRRGIIKGTKPMVTLLESFEDSMNSGDRFANIKEGEAAVLEIDAIKAYEDGIDFSSSGVQGVFLCEFVSHRYISAIHYQDGTKECVKEGK